MNDTRQIHSGHPLLNELRNGLFWHRTNPTAFRAIQKMGSLNPNEGPHRWGNRPYACQTLGAICLFDFTTVSEARVLETANRWQQFMGDERPVTIVMGLSPEKLSGLLIRYPETRDGTPSDSKGPIPWVEVCHVGPIPFSAVVSFLLVCPVDYSCFKKCSDLDETTLNEVISEFLNITSIYDKRKTTHA